MPTVLYSMKHFPVKLDLTKLWIFSYLKTDDLYVTKLLFLMLYLNTLLPIMLHLAMLLHHYCIFQSCSFVWCTSPTLAYCAASLSYSPLRFTSLSSLTRQECSQLCLFTASERRSVSARCIEDKRATIHDATDGVPRHKEARISIFAPLVKFHIQMSFLYRVYRMTFPSVPLVWEWGLMVGFGDVWLLDCVTVWLEGVM